MMDACVGRVLGVQSGLGSYGVMERITPSKANDITFGASVSQGTPLMNDVEVKSTLVSLSNLLCFVRCRQTNVFFLLLTLAL